MFINLEGHNISDILWFEDRFNLIKKCLEMLERFQVIAETQKSHKKLVLCLKLSTFDLITVYLTVGYEQHILVLV